MEEKPYFPMFVDLSDKQVVVVGAGTIAKRRIRTLISFTDHVKVIAPEVNKELLDLQADGKISIEKKHYEREDLYGADLVIAATSDAKTNNDIYAACRCLGITVNVCSDKNKCDFYFPGIAMKDNVVVGVTASGQDHRQARKVIEMIRSQLQPQPRAAAAQPGADTNKRLRKEEADDMPRRDAAADYEPACGSSAGQAGVHL